MTWFRCGGGSGMPADLKNRMNAVFNKKFGTAVDYPPEGWPDDVNLMGPLPEKTIVSSPIADFSDGADDVPTKSLVVTIPATLSGVSAITETQTGRNLLNDSIRGANGANIFFGHDTGTQNDFSVRLRAGTYTFSVVTADGTITNLYVKNSDTNTNITGFPAYGVLSKTFTLTEDTNCAVFAYKSGYTDVTDILTAQIEFGSTAHSYEPYTAPTTYTANLGRTIYGGEVDIVNGTGTDENGNDFTFDGQEASTRLGYNAFWSDDGDTEVTYRADISLALQAVSGSRGLMMTRPAIEPANGDQVSEESMENNIETEGEQDPR